MNKLEERIYTLLKLKGLAEGMDKDTVKIQDLIREVNKLNYNNQVDADLKTIDEKIDVIEKKLAPSTDAYEDTKEALFALLSSIEDIEGINYHKYHEQIIDLIHELTVCRADADLTNVQKFRKLEEIREEIIRINGEVYDIKTSASELY